MELVVKGGDSVVSKFSRWLMISVEVGSSGAFRLVDDGQMVELNYAGGCCGFLAVVCEASGGLNGSLLELLEYSDGDRNSDLEGTN